jgi:Co/Zn/Cd efflux system component
MAHEHISNLSHSTIRRLALSLVITLVFVVIEILAGVFANSLALLTDAAHNLTDVLALALTWWALRITTKPANSGKTYGYPHLLGDFLRSVEAFHHAACSRSQYPHRRRDGGSSHQSGDSPAGQARQ